MFALSASSPLWRLALLCITSSRASLLPHRVEEPVDALALDDACGGGVDVASACALSARQLRGRPEVVEASRKSPEVVLQAALHTAESRRRRRHRIAGVVQDISAAEEAKFTRKVNATNERLQELQRSLQVVERFENETRRMAIEQPAVRRSVHAAARGPLLQEGKRQALEAELSPAATRKRRHPHFEIPMKARRLRRVVQALDFLEQDMDSVRLRITWLDRLNDWTNGKIDNPTVPDLKKSRPGGEQSTSDVDEASSADGKLHSAAGPVASMKHLESQLEAINEELAEFDAVLPALDANAKGTRNYYLRKLARLNMTDTW